MKRIILLALGMWLIQLSAISITLTDDTTITGILISCFRGDYYVLVEENRVYKIDNRLVKETSNATEADLNILLAPSSSKPVNVSQYAALVDVSQEMKRKNPTTSFFLSNVVVSVNGGFTSQNAYNTSGQAFSEEDHITWLGDKAVKNSYDITAKLGYTTGRKTELGVGVSWQAKRKFKALADKAFSYLPLFGYARYEFHSIPHFQFAAFAQMGYGINAINEGFLGYPTDYSDEVPYKVRFTQSGGGVCFGFGLETVVKSIFTVGVSYHSFSGYLDYEKRKKSGDVYEVVGTGNHSIVYDYVSFNVGVRYHLGR